MLFLPPTPFTLYPFLLAPWRELVALSSPVTRAAMLLVAAFALLGVYYLARRLANRQVAVATVICTALYPVFFTESLLAHADVAVTALTLWGLAFYLPASDLPASHPPVNYLPAKPVENFDEAPAASFEKRGPRRVFLSVIFFSIAALVKASALLAPLALFVWEIFCNRRSRKSVAASSSVIKSRSKLYEVLVLLLPLCVLALWLAYQYQRTGYIYGYQESFNSSVEWLHPLPLLKAGAVRIWEALGHMRLFVLTIAGLLAMTRPALPPSWKPFVR